MNNAEKYIFFFLLVFAVGLAISQQNEIQLGNIDSSQSGSISLCDPPSNGSVTNHSGDNDPMLAHAPESNSEDEQPRTITSCNSLLNILPVESNFSFNPGAQQVNIGFYNAVLSSQIFVFQEPDPPRLG